MGSQNRDPIEPHMSELKYSLWRQSPTLSSDDRNLPEVGLSGLGSRHIFPSGRQAITEIMQRITGGRASRVSIPEWSSHCVVSSVGRVATPIPLHEVLKGNHRVDAVLVYDQYGWPKRADSLSALSKHVDAAIVHDCVDSLTGFEDRLPDGVTHRVWSLSKTLGFLNGGAARSRNEFIEFPKDERAVSDTDVAMARAADPIAREFAKSWLPYRDTALLSALDGGALSSIVSREILHRRSLLKIFLSSAFAADIPEWMKIAAQNGAAPNLVPCVLGAGPSRMQRRQQLICDVQERFRLEARVYHFDFSDDPMSPSYRSAIVLPIHGEITDQVFSDTIAYLEKSR